MKDLKPPPGKLVHWLIQSSDGVRFVAKGQTAFEAASMCGLTLAQTRDNIRWVDLRTVKTEPEPGE